LASQNIHFYIYSQDREASLVEASLDSHGSGPIVSGLVSFLIFGIPLERVIALLFFAFACIGFAYYIRVRPSIKVNRAVYVMLGISPIGFCLSLVWIFTIGRYTTPLLGILGFFIGLIVPCTIGAFIGDWIGKRRNYQLPLWP
jgi:hypothetical protein